MPHLCRILQECTKSGASDTHLATCLKSPSDIACNDATYHDNGSDLENRKMKKWWKQFSRKMRRSQRSDVSEPMEVHLNGKKYMELSAVYCGQEIRAHSGLIWTIKFSPDGKYLASGGEDGVVRIWLVTFDSSCEPPKFNLNVNRSKYGHKKRKSFYSPVIVPEKVFKIDESPLHEFHGHTDGILDIAWSSSNCLLSSSKDNTVRLWKIGSHGCHGVFHHKNYVTCIQFNPVNDNIFISGSIDGKVRIWGVPEKRVQEWTDAHDIVTSVAYQPNGKGFILGCISGNCRFYELNEFGIFLNTQIHLHRKKKSSGSGITGIQFFQNDSQRVMITSEDSKIHILDGTEVVHKFKGKPKSGNHTSATFTSTGKHIISVGEDSRIYLWDYDDISIQASKQTKSTWSCEHFHSKGGVSVAITWSCPGTTAADSENFEIRYSKRFSLRNWFNMDVSSRGSVTWPEEMLLPYDKPNEENEEHVYIYDDDRRYHQRQGLCPAWGLVFVTAGSDGKIRTFHNYGLPGWL